MRLYEFMWLIAFILLCILIIVAPDMDKPNIGFFSCCILTIVILSGVAYGSYHGKM